MSSNRLSYDTCSYTHSLGESVGVGDYMINTPTQDCNQCESTSPYIRPVKKFGPSYGSAWVDTSSELLGLTRPASRCPSNKYIPGEEDKQHKLSNLPECTYLTTEDTKLSNPPCTLRGTGINRFEFLPEQPQKHAITPFHRFGINVRAESKENHVPCMPTPGDHSVEINVLPGSKERVASCVYGQEFDETYFANKWKNAPQPEPSMYWNTCDKIKNI